MTFVQIVGKPEGKRPLGIPKCRLEDGVRMNLRKIGSEVETAIISLNSVNQLIL
jgi:hypothetical protein